VEPGSRLLHYELVGKLGAGGMGEVHRARDTRLGRDVAIKILPPHLVDDAERLARFEREAKVLAQLNHPNVAQIHGVDQVDETCFLVLELVAGESLGQRLARGPLPMAEALDVARQIAEGLEAAHGAGIVHRDLKPANVCLDEEGRVKLLDFGLAKAHGGDGDSGPTVQLESDSFELTREGVVMGTPTYMSPEQARGRKVDLRTDIWSFGCVLFECLTGQRAFGGETTTDVLGAIVHTEPDWSKLPKDTPPRVVELLRRCLAKSARDRLQAIGEARIALAGALAGDGGAADTAAAAPVRRGWWRVVAVGLLGLLIGLAVADETATDGAPDAEARPLPMHHLTIEVPDDLEVVVVAGVTLDESALAYIARPRAGTEGVEPVRRLYLRRLDGFETTVVPHTERVNWAAFSPDSRWLAWFSWDEGGERGTIRKALVDGGPPVTLLSDVEANPWVHAAWTEGGIITNTNRSLLRLSPEGGPPETLLELEPATGILLHTSSIPGSEKLLVAVGSIEQGNYVAHTELFTPSTGERQRLLESAIGAYIPSGHLIVSGGEGMLAAPFDVEAVRITGPQVPLFPPGHGRFISPSGMLVTMESGAVKPRAVVVDLADGSLQVVGEAIQGPIRRLNGVRWSPDGRRVLVETVAERRSVLVVHDLQLGTATRLGLPDASTTSGEWSPDGQHVAYQARISTSAEIQIRRTDGRDAPRRLHADSDPGVDLHPCDWSPDGSTLLLARHVGDEPATLWMMDVSDVGDGRAGDGDDEGIDGAGDGSSPRPFLPEETDGHGGRFSPDGRWVAFESDEAGQMEVFITPFPPEAPGSGARLFQASVGGGRQPSWSADGQTLYYLDGQDRLLSVTVNEVPGPSPALGFGQTVPVADLAALSLRTELVQAYDLSPDNTRVALIQQHVAGGSGNDLLVVLNWFQELERIAPTGR
jgi:Tol biopolymer transport system component/tRNA A-37 threonylcarbamoyl transferase component Bud32